MPSAARAKLFSRASASRFQVCRSPDRPTLPSLPYASNGLASGCAAAGRSVKPSHFSFFKREARVSAALFFCCWRGRVSPLVPSALSGSNICATAKTQQNQALGISNHERAGQLVRAFGQIVRRVHAASGNQTVKAVPFPSVLTAEIFPF